MEFDGNQILLETIFSWRECTLEVTISLFLTTYLMKAYISKCKY